MRGSDRSGGGVDRYPDLDLDLDDLCTAWWGPVSKSRIHARPQPTFESRAPHRARAEFAVSSLRF